MFTNISWLQYLMVAAPVICCYYLYVAVKYYRTDIQDLLGQKQRDFSPEWTETEAGPIPETLSATTDGPGTDTSDQQQDQFDQIEKLVGDLKYRIAQAAGTNTLKGALAESLTAAIRQYPELKNTPYKTAINELIVYECAQQNLATLSETEVEGLW